MLHPQQHQQQQQMQLLVAERLRAASTMQASQTAVQNVCLQTLRGSSNNPTNMLPLLQQQQQRPYHHPASNALLTPNHPNPTLLARPTTHIDLSGLSILRLLQLRDMLSRGSS